MKGRLDSGKNIFLLFDSGATKTLISDRYVKSTPHLSKLKRQKVAHTRFKLGNGQFLHSQSAITFRVTIQGHKFEISALIVENLVGVDLILGTNTLSDLDGTLTFRNNRFKIKQKRIPFSPTNKVTINPKDSTLMTLQGQAPPQLRNADVILTAHDYLSRHCPSTMVVTLIKGRTQILVTNTSDRPLQFAKGRPIAYLDMTCPITVTEPLPTDKVNVTLIDQHTDNIYSTQLSTPSPDGNHGYQTRQDNLKMYPHLDPSDPIASMTEEQIIKEHIDLHDSILSPTGL